MWACMYVRVAQPPLMLDPMELELTDTLNYHADAGNRIQVLFNNRREN